MAADDPGVAASVEAVEESERILQARARANPSPPVKKVVRRNGVAPAVSVEQLRTKLLYLASSLHAPSDTEAAQIGSVFGIDFVPELLAIREGDAVGELRDLGSYWVSVMGLYKGALGKNVEVTFGPKVVPGQRPARCTFDFKPFAGELVAMGYRMGKSGVRHLERWSFVRPSTSAGTSIYVGVHLYRADDGTEEGRACVSSVDVNVDRSQG